MTAKYQLSKPFGINYDQLFEHCVNAVQAGKFKLTEADRSTGKILAKANFSFLSWGEILTIKISEDGTVEAESKCILFMQITSYGKNKRNVIRFFDELNKRINF